MCEWELTGLTMLKTVKSLTKALDLKLGRDGHFENIIAQIFNRKLLIF